MAEGGELDVPIPSRGRERRTSSPSRRHSVSPDPSGTRSLYPVLASVSSTSPSVPGPAYPLPIHTRRGRTESVNAIRQASIPHIITPSLEGEGEEGSGAQHGLLSTCSSSASLVSQQHQVPLLPSEFEKHKVGIRRRTMCLSVCAFIVVIAVAAAAILVAFHEHHKKGDPSQPLDDRCPDGDPVFFEDPQDNDYEGNCCPFYARTCCTTFGCTDRVDYNYYFMQATLHCDNALGLLTCAPCSATSGWFAVSVGWGGVNVCEKFCAELHHACLGATIWCYGQCENYGKKVLDVYPTGHSYEFCTQELLLSLNTSRLCFSGAWSVSPSLSILLLVFSVVLVVWM